MVFIAEGGEESKRADVAVKDIRFVSFDLADGANGSGSTSACPDWLHVAFPYFLSPLWSAV